MQEASNQATKHESSDRDNTRQRLDNGKRLEAASEQVNAGMAGVSRCPASLTAVLAADEQAATVRRRLGLTTHTHHYSPAVLLCRYSYPVLFIADLTLPSLLETPPPPSILCSAHPSALCVESLNRERQRACAGVGT